MVGCIFVLLSPFGFLGEGQPWALLILDWDPWSVFISGAPGVPGPVKLHAPSLKLPSRPSLGKNVDKKTYQSTLLIMWLGLGLPIVQ